MAYSRVVLSYLRTLIIPDGEKMLVSIALESSKKWLGSHFSGMIQEQQILPLQMELDSKTLDILLQLNPKFLINVS